jgi:hypothetical protein
MCSVQNTSKSLETALLSRFWAFYRLLPESLRDGFIGVAQGISQDYANSEQCRKAVDGK